MRDLEFFSIKNCPYQFRYAATIEEIKEEWTSLIPNNIFWSLDFIRLVENHPPLNLQQRYALLYKDEEPIAVVLLQLKYFSLSETFNNQISDRKQTRSQALGNRMKLSVSKSLSANTLICGHVLLTGEYGYHFKAGSVALEKQLPLIDDLTVELSKVIKKKEGKKISLILMKDFNHETTANIRPMKNTSFEIQPNMMMYLKEEWSSFDDYLKAIKSKYRVRVKRARKKSHHIEKRILDVEDIKAYNSRIHELYKETASDAGFNLFTLPHDYFIRVKEYLQDKVKLVGYFEEGKMIGYYSLVINTEYMEAHYLGYQKSRNADCQTYLNMLYDLIAEGIALSSNKIQFARTALEIKSSVGAVPVEMICYLRHTQGSLNRLVSPVLNYFLPKEEWEARTPFKKEN